MLALPLDADVAKRLTIAGGGLAGLACGIRLAEAGWQVTVHEKRRYPLKKVCGEFLSPQGWRRVQSLGAAALLPQQPRELKRARFYADDRSHFDFALAPAAWGLSRGALDTALAERFRQAGGILLEGSELNALAPGDLDARGRPAAESMAAWMGWKAYLPKAVDLPELEEADMLMLPVLGGYCGLSRIEDGRVSVCLVAREGLALQDILTSHPLLAAQSSLLKAHAAIAHFDFKAYPGPGRLGDARRVWPPLVGDGMSQALAAGEAMAAELVGGRVVARPAVGLQFLMAKGMHGAMLNAFPRSLVATVCRTFPGLPEALYKISRG